MTVVRLRDLCVERDGRSILRNVSLELAPGGVVGLIGPNGAGKSTLLRAIVGLAPARGDISFDGVPLAGIARRELARLTSFLPQDRDVAWPLSVEAVVELGRTPYLSPFSGLSAQDRTEVETAMRLTDTAHLRDRDISTLSGGERARVLMARVLAQAAPVLIADEPTAGLDPGHQLALLEAFHELAAAGRTVVVSLHEIALAARWCDRIVLLDHGRIVADGTPASVLTTENFATVYGVRIHAFETEHGLFVQPTSRLSAGERG